MFFYLLLLFTIVPAVELTILIKVGGHIGVGNTLLLIVATGVAGAYLARMQGFLVLNKIQQDMNKGLLPNEELLDGLMILVGGIVLLTPGFVTDAIGFVLLIPLTRALIKRLLKSHFEKMIKNGQSLNVDFNQNKRDNTNQSSGYDDIDI